ncbi:chemotaxis-specific protein-glutamate methyltransferase CheB [Aquibacillus halophilus]|uniref:Protein-glutamate methylesterase/protein-glutamine glutaminase n=1 Tax=Aquibacillus halophilus TaxID=930132 RepID=A0A6A8DEK4_9BACI|nr:chemotaxis response regulator protein-glutamate methylesterase [Aquibacillus halophilus]MRH42279.1 chemotaxis-specific protein-glutamate methyltransferase CheB [Aquibacillus halophilus]
MKEIKVLVVDDSAFMRKVISDILNSSPEINVIGTAKNGEDALIKLKQLSPDVLTLDVEMPIMNGISTLNIIMREMPLPVIMLSSLTKEGTDKTIQAMSLGAVDFITKPSGPISLDIEKVKGEIIDKVIAASKTSIHKYVTKGAQLESKNKSTDFRFQNNSSSIGSSGAIVAIGTSTGGPRALQQVLTNLPEDFPAPIVVVQHMPPGFTKSLSNRLNTLSKIKIKEAVDGELLLKGTAYIAPGGYHLRVKESGKSLTAHVSQDLPRNGHQPSVDVLFESLVKQQMFQTYAVIMTGMGSDGTKGAKALKEVKSDTVIVAESEKSAIVYGMPQAVIKTNLVDYIEELDNISSLLIDKIKNQR